MRKDGGGCEILSNHTVSTVAFPVNVFRADFLSSDHSTTYHFVDTARESITFITLGIFIFSKASGIFPTSSLLLDNLSNRAGLLDMLGSRSWGD